MVIQRTYRTHQQPYYVGQLAKPFAPHAFDVGPLNIPTGGVDVKPGWPVRYDRTNDAYQLPTTAAEELETIGIVSFDSAVTAKSVTRPAGANSPSAIEFKDGNAIKVLRFGHVAVQVNSAVEYGQRLYFDTTNRVWEVVAPTFAGISGLPAANGLTGSVDGSQVTDNLTTLFTALETALNVFARMPFVVASPGAHSANDIVEVAVGYGAGVS